MSTFATCLWFDGAAEEAVGQYVSIFKDAHLGDVSRLPDGSALMVTFDLGGQQFTALNGGPQFSFTEAFSIVVNVEDQAELDRVWAALTEGGEEGNCGWLKDRFGLSWQVVPRALATLMSDPDPAKAAAVGAAMRTMHKIDVGALEAAHSSA